MQESWIEDVKESKKYNIKTYSRFFKYGNGPNDEYSLSQGSIDYNKTILISFDSTKLFTFSELKIIMVADPKT